MAEEFLSRTLGSIVFQKQKCWFSAERERESEEPNAIRVQVHTEANWVEGFEASIRRRNLCLTDRSLFPDGEGRVPIENVQSLLAHTHTSCIHIYIYILYVCRERSLPDSKQKAHEEQATERHNTTQKSIEATPDSRESSSFSRVNSHLVQSHLVEGRRKTMRAFISNAIALQKRSITNMYRISAIIIFPRTFMY